MYDESFAYCGILLARRDATVYVKKLVSKDLEINRLMTLGGVQKKAKPVKCVRRHATFDVSLDLQAPLHVFSRFVF